MPRAGCSIVGAPFEAQGKQAEACATAEISSRRRIILLHREGNAVFCAMRTHFTQRESEHRSGGRLVKIEFDIGTGPASLPRSFHSEK